MSGRGRLPPHAMKGAPPPSAHEPHFGGRGPLPPHLLDDPHFPDAPPFGPPRRGPALPPHLLDDRISLQHQEIQTLLVDNQHLAATHVALKQELSAVQQELHHASRTIAAMQLEKDSRFREMESELRAADAMRAELAQIHGEIQKVGLERQELAGQVQALTHDLARNSTEMQQAPILKQQIEVMKQQIQHARACIEHEKKGYADNYEQGQVMQKNLVSMAREVEKLRAEIANAEKRARAAAAAGNQAAGYGGSYANPGPDPSYGGNPYPAGYGMNPVSGTGVAETASQYGSGNASVPSHNSWGAYDMQRAPARR